MGLYSCNTVWPGHSTTEAVGSVCFIWAPLAHGCSMSVLSRGHRAHGLPFGEAQAVVRSLCPLRYGERLILGPNHAPTPSVDGVNICVYQLGVGKKKKKRGVEVHHSPTQVGAPLLSRLWVLHRAWAKESDSLQTCLLSPAWFHVTWRSCTDCFFPASFPAVGLVPTSCEVAVGTGVVTAAGGRGGEDQCEYLSACHVSGLEKAFGGLSATVHPETPCSGGRRPSHALVLLLSGALSWGLDISSVFQRR